MDHKEPTRSHEKLFMRFPTLDTRSSSGDICAMSLPPGFLDELRNRLSLAQVVGRKVVWDARKSNQGKGDFWAPCPFHQEKTASFHVDDKKGFYYCFGCHAKGDALRFVRETENVGFLEAVEILAREAGMPMPAPDPQAQEKADARDALISVMEQATRFYAMSLKTQNAQAARAYLEKRGLDADALARWQIGYAPNGRTALYQHLREKGVAEDAIFDAGLCARSDHGSGVYDRFRDRIIFPIFDMRARPIAFGGRAMDPNARAKYLNSPETRLFDKGRNLYNQDRARAAMGKATALIVAEGYMDVIALSEAGFPGAVAPLGTAITEEQLALLWRISPEPVIALDGDAAGLRAAYRLIDLALPKLGPNQALRFMMMPSGQDPDDVIRQGGRSALQKHLDGAIPLVNLLWQRETENKIFDSPERKAALDVKLRQALAMITDASLRQHYTQAIKDLRWSFFRSTTAKGPKKWQKSAQQATPLARHSPLAQAQETGVEYYRHRMILLLLSQFPEILPEFSEELSQLPVSEPQLCELQDALLRLANAEQIDDIVSAKPEFLGDALEKLSGDPQISKLFAMICVNDVARARRVLHEEFGKLFAQTGLLGEIAEAARALEQGDNELIDWRLREAVAAKTRLGRQDESDGTEYDLAENGARLNRTERQALDSLLAKLNKK